MVPALVQLGLVKVDWRIAPERTGGLGELTEAKDDFVADVEGDGDLLAEGDGAFEADEAIGAGEGALNPPVPPDDFRSWNLPRLELAVLLAYAESTSRDRSRDVCICLMGFGGQ